MDAGRRCFRLVGEVLVERNVGETLPAVEKNKGNLEGVITSLKTAYLQQEKDLAEFQSKYKIRWAGPHGRCASGGGGGGRGSKKRRARG
jgi:prefoldin subunit 2